MSPFSLGRIHDSFFTLDPMSLVLTAFSFRRAVRVEKIKALVKETQHLHTLSLLVREHVFGASPAFHQLDLHPQSIQLSTPASIMSQPRITEIADDAAKQERLHILFNQWVPNYKQYRQITRGLGLDEADYKAIKNEITEYRLKVAQAKVFHETYTAP